MVGVADIPFIYFIPDENINGWFFVFFYIDVPSANGIFKTRMLSHIEKNQENVRTGVANLSKNMICFC